MTELNKNPLFAPLVFEVVHKNVCVKCSAEEASE